MKEIQAHHIKLWKDYPDLRFEVDNGVTLCKRCHIEIHRDLRKKGEFGGSLKMKINGNPELSRKIANRLPESVTVRAEETITPISALPERDDMTCTLEKSKEVE